MSPQERAAKSKKKTSSHQYPSENLTPEEAERLQALEWENKDGLKCNLCKVRIWGHFNEQVR